MRPVPRVNKQQRAAVARRVSRATEGIAPVGGLNTRDSLSLMQPTDAFSLQNWLPSSAGLQSRKGHAPATTDYAEVPETIIEYLSGTTNVLITGADDKLFTDDGAGTATQIGSSYSSDRWRAASIGANMILVNGADDPQQFDGSTISVPTYTGDLNTYGETNINGIKKYRNRLYMWDTDYGNFFYGGVNAVSGAFAEFQLSRVSDTGGNILEVKSISRDGGAGPDDYLAFILNTGEVLIYQGGDPGTASDFALIGKYMTPPLIATNCAVEYGGDVLLLTQQDVVRLSDVIKYGDSGGGFAVSPSKISGSIRDDYALYGTNYGWDIFAYPAEGWIMVNVPVTTNSEYHQYVINTITGASTQFTGWDGSKFGTLGNKLFFSNGTVLYQANTGLDDNGADIQLFAAPAFTNLGINYKKAVANARMYFRSEGDLNINLSLAYDYDQAIFQGTQTSTTSGAEWDDEFWDDPDWAGESARVVDFTTSGIGVYISPRVSMNISGQEVFWYSTTYNYRVAETY